MGNTLTIEINYNIDKIKDSTLFLIIDDIQKRYPNAKVTIRISNGFNF